MEIPDPAYLSTVSAARHCGCPAWQIRRLYERGILPPPPRIGAYRAIPVSDLPLIEKALRAAGYLSRKEATKEGGAE